MEENDAFFDAVWDVATYSPLMPFRTLYIFFKLCRSESGSKSLKMRYKAEELGMYEAFLEAAPQVRKRVWEIRSVIRGSISLVI